jgi:hypothetical protein
MPANTTHGLPYPLGTEPIAQGDDAIKNLATALDPAVRTSPLAAQTGWGTPTDVRLYRIGFLCCVHFRAARTGADIVPPAGSLNIGDVDIAGPVPSDMIPPDRVYGGLVTTSSIVGGCRLNGTAQGATAGVFTVATLSGTFSTGQTLDCDIFYTLA